MDTNYIANTSETVAPVCMELQLVANPGENVNPSLASHALFIIST